MQITQHVSLAFLTDAPSDKTVLGSKTHDALTTNAATFPNLPHLPAAIKAANDDLVNKIAAAENHDRAAIDNRDASEVAWDKIMKENAKYVETMANGDVTIIDKSGYPATKDKREPRSVPNDCQNHQTSVDGLVGRVKTSVNADTNIDAFLFIAKTLGVTIQQMGNQINFTVGAEKISIIIDTHRAVTFTGLVSHVPMQV